MSLALRAATCLIKITFTRRQTKAQLDHETNQLSSSSLSFPCRAADRRTNERTNEGREDSLERTEETVGHFCCLLALAKELVAPRQHPASLANRSQISTLASSATGRLAHMQPASSKVQPVVANSPVRSQQHSSHVLGGLAAGRSQRPRAGYLQNLASGGAEPSMRQN